MEESEEFADLLADLRAGDELAAGKIVEEYTDALVAVARRQIGGKLARRVDPEDIIQSTYRSLFVRVQKGEYELGSGRELWKLLVTMTLNKVRRKAKYHGTQRRDVNLDQSVANDDNGSYVDRSPSGGPTPADAAALVDELQSVLAELKPRDRQVIELRLQGCSTAEIAAETGRSERSIRRVLQHQGEQLRKAIEE